MRDDMQTRLTHIAFATALVMTSTLAACNRQPTDAQAEYDEMKNNASERIDQAQAGVREGLGEAGAALDDAAITAKVKAGIVAEPGLDALDISVDTAAGVVTLSGTVDSSEHSARAEEIARASAGVKSVDNRLDIQAKS